MDVRFICVMLTAITLVLVLGLVLDLREKRAWKRQQYTALPRHMRESEQVAAQAWRDYDEQGALL